jgi:hypothetical protein
MGDEADALSDWLEDVDDDLPGERPRSRRAKRKSRPAFRESGYVYHPGTDDAARREIKRLKHYDWVTIQVRGRWTHNPYKIVAVIDGTMHTIHLPGRRGSVLRWLRDKKD